MTIRLSDLSPRARAQVAAAMGASAPTRPKKSHRVASGHTTWRCHACRFTTTVLDGARGIEDHCHAEGHVRYEVVL